MSEEVHDAFVEFLDLYPLKEMDAVIVTKKKDRVTDAEKVERLAKRYWWAIVILGITTGVFCKLYVIYHCRHHHTRKKYRQLKVKHRHLEWQHGRLTFVDDAPQQEDAGEPFIDRDADESVAKQGWAAIRHAVKGTKAQKLGGIVREASRKDVENPVRPEHHISQALTDAKREHAAHLLKIADLEDELRVSRLNVTPDRADGSGSESGFTEAMNRAPPAPSPRGPPAPPTPPPPAHRTPGSPATPHVDLE